MYRIYMNFGINTAEWDIFRGIYMRSFSYYMSVQKVSSNVVWRIDTVIKEDARYKKHCTQGNDNSVPFEVSSLGPHTVLPITISCPILFSWILSTVWNLFPFKGDFIVVLGKARNHRVPNLGCRGLSHLSDLSLCQRTLHNMWYMSGLIVLTKLPVTSCL